MLHEVRVPQVPIDVVFTWVDGDDPSWRDEFQWWSSRVRTTTGPDARDPARYRDNGELRYALRSVWMFAGWVRRIHIVTCGHLPGWLVPDPRIRTVQHRQIFDVGDLPTFNSHAIEARLHRIPGLAEQFVYLNDDVFLSRPVGPGLFFTEAAVPLVALSRHPVPRPSSPTAATVDHSAHVGAELIARDTGRRPLRRPHHGPFALRRSHLAELEQRFSPEIAATVSHRFRSPSDVSLPTFLAPMHGLATGRAGPSSMRLDYVGVESPGLALHLARLGPRTTFDAFCLNDTERRPRDPARTRRRVDAFLARRYPRSAPWERSDVTASQPA